jgi:hypothetical protein
VRHKELGCGGCGRLTFIGKEHGSFALGFYTRERGSDRVLANESGEHDRAQATEAVQIMELIRKERTPQQIVASEVSIFHIACNIVDRGY